MHEGWDMFSTSAPFCSIFLAPILVCDLGWSRP